MTWYNEDASGLLAAATGGDIDFLAVDVETANASFASICQIGVVAFSKGEIVQSWCSLVNPEDEFDWMNVSIHGIEEAHVRSAPRWCDIYPYLMEIFAGKIIVTHTAFDRGAIRQASSKYNLPAIDLIWLDAARVVRRTWPEFSSSGYGLKNVAQFLGIQFKHHDAREDAQTCGKILVSAVRVSELSINDWLVRVRKPINLAAIQQPGDVSGPLHGEVAVFTGALVMPRWEAAAMAAKLGWDVRDGVTKHTTLLICGDQDIRLLNGHERSGKHRKAEMLIQKGQDIRILPEQDFLDLTVAHSAAA